MVKFQAEVWTEAPDQHGRLCWYNHDGSKATYEPPGEGAMFNSMRWCPPQPIGPGPPMQPFPRTVVIVKEKVKPDKWTKYCDKKTGKEYYHNPGKGKTQWEKPEDFDKQENAGKPKPPDDPPKKKKPKSKYALPCKCGCQ
ncbi:unnamed protein product [Scytosiphon promiscuus]